MKWFLGLVVALNLFVGAVMLLRQHEPVDIHSHEVSPELLKVLPAGWQLDASASASLTASAPLSASAPLTLAQTTNAPLGMAASVPVAKTEASAGHAKTVKPAGKASDKSKKAASVPAVAHPAKADARQCASWGGLSDTLLARVQDGLPALHLSADQISRRAVEGKATGALRYWVYIPGKEVTASLSGELKGKGFDNYAVQNAGDYKGALSLGLFGKQDGAQALVDRLKKAGFDKAAVLARGKTALTQVDFKNLSESQLQALAALQKRLTPGIALQSAVCSR
jgi:hypothetical protein